MGLVFEYVKELYGVLRSKVIINNLLIVVLGLLQGVGVMIIIPLLSVIGVIGDMQADSMLTIWMNNFFQYIGLPMNLPAVLLLYIGINLGQSLIERYQSLLTIEIQQKFTQLLGFRLCRAVMYADWQLIMNRPRSEIANALVMGLVNIAGVVNVFFSMLTSSIITLLQLALAFLIAPVLTGMVLLCASGLFVFLRRFSKVSRKYGEEALALNNSSFNSLMENLQGIKEIKCYSIEEAQFDYYRHQIMKMNGNYMRFANFQSWTDMSYKVGAVVFISLFLFCATTLFKLQAQDLILIAVISYRLWPRFSALQNNYQNLNRLIPSVQFIKELETQCLAAQENLPDDARESGIVLQTGVEFRQVSFIYHSAPEKYAIKSANFLLPAGTTTALVGVSGAGKTTLIDLLMGLLTPSEGDILLDGRPIREELRPWRRSIGYVSQDPFLINGSIRENLLWACPDASEEDMWAALKMAAADGFVQGLATGLDSVVGDRGVRISGGERQRIVLARALLKKPSGLILDEATSSLDSENEQSIQQAIEGLKGKLTIVIIAHRISTVKNVDQILVVEQGEIIEQGNYQSLIQNKAGRFHALASSYIADNIGAESVVEHAGVK